MLFVGLSMLGYISYTKLRVELMPDIEYPFLNVSVTPGFQAELSYLEQAAAIPVEGVVSSMEYVEEIETRISRNACQVTVFYNTGTDMQFAYLQLEERLRTLEKQLPEGFRVTLAGGNVNMNVDQFMQIQLKGFGGSDRLRKIFDERVLNRLLGVDGIAGVNVSGGREKSIEVILDHSQCKALNITPSQVKQAIEQGAMQKSFMGMVRDGKERISVNLSSEYQEVDDLYGVVIKEEGPVFLREVAEVHFGYKEEESYSRVNGQSAISGVLVKTREANLIAVSDDVKEVIAELNEEFLADEIVLNIETNTAAIMEDNIDRIIELALIGACLAVLVLWLFLRNLSMVAIVSLVIPISILTAYNGFYAMGLSINMLTLIGITLAVGMLLDNSVVVMENIYRLRAQGMNPMEAAIQGTKEVARAIVAATLTTITVFIPFMFTSTQELQVFGEHIGISIVLTLLVSLVVACLLIPMITHQIFTRQKGTIKLQRLSFHNRLLQIYLLLLKTALRKPVQTILGALSLFFVTVMLCLAASMIHTKPMQTKEFSVYVTMPEGSSLEQTNELVSRLETAFLTYVDSRDTTQQGIPDIEQLIADIYEEEAKITLLVRKDFEETRARKLLDIRDDISRAYDKLLRQTDAQISMYASRSSDQFRGGGNRSMNMMRMMGVGSNTERVLIKGSDFEVMQLLASDLAYMMEEMEEVDQVWVDNSRQRPEATIAFEPLLMELYGIQAHQISTELQGFSPETSSNTIFKDGVDEYEVIIKDLESMKLAEKDLTIDKDLGDLQGLTLRGSMGSSHELRSFSSIELSQGDADIVRKNQSIELGLSYLFHPNYEDSPELQDAARMKIKDMLATLYVPAGIGVEVIEPEEETDEFSFLILIAALLIYMILAAVFESLLAPIVLMFSIPMAAIGSFLALYLSKNSLFSITAMTGFIILIGVVVNNSIILIDYVRILRKRGFSRNRAIISSGLSRLRPILITVITSVVALLPMAMDTEEYAGAMGAPFAITVIGGLLVSTLLTLIFIPTLYSGMEQAVVWQKSLPWYVQCAQAVCLLGVSYWIYNMELEMMWKLLYGVLLFIAIQGLSYFLLNSFRKANEALIPADEAMHIRISNLVKIYDRPSRFSREWNAGILRRRARGEHRSYQSWRDFTEWIWQVPLLIFTSHLAFFYLESIVWIYVMALVFWLLALHMLHNVYHFVKHTQGRMGKFSLWLCKALLWILRWGTPLGVILFINRIQGELLGLAIFFSSLWYLGIFIKRTADKMFKENIKIDAISGRLGWMRRLRYRFVSIIPVLGKKKKPFRANSMINLEIHPGMFGLLGPNGAGKTTLMRILCGVLEQSYGKIFINGIDTQEKREELQGLIGYLPQEFGTYENLSAADFLDYQAILKGIKQKQVRAQRVAEVLESVHMTEHSKKKIGSFSGGMKQRIGIAQTLLHLPRILVVDEPTAGLDPRERIRFRNLLVELSRQRIVIFSTHIIEDIASSCKQVAVINKGKLHFNGKPAEMQAEAEGKVWVFEVPIADFEEATQELLVIHHAKKNEYIKVRCLAMEKPYPTAENVKPMLEDSYLWTLNKGL